MHQFQGLKPVPANLVELINGLQQRQHATCYQALNHDPALALRFFLAAQVKIDLTQDFDWANLNLFESNTGLPICLGLALNLDYQSELLQQQQGFCRYSLEAAFLARAIASLQPQKVAPSWAYISALLAGFTRSDTVQEMPALEPLAHWLAHQNQIPLLLRQAWLYQAELELDIAETPALVQLNNICSRYVRQSSSLVLPQWFVDAWQISDELLAELYLQVQQEVKPLLAPSQFGLNYQQVLQQQVQQHLSLNILQQSFVDLDQAMLAFKQFSGLDQGQLWLQKDDQLSLVWPQNSYPHLAELKVDCKQSRSILAQVAVKKQAQVERCDANLGIVEQQILAGLASLAQQGYADKELLFISSLDPQQGWVWVGLADEIQSALFMQANYQSGVSCLINQHLGDLAVQGWQSQALQELYHEVANPLTVVRNYLAGLKLTSDVDPALGAKLGKMESELGRASELLQTLKKLPKPANIKTCDINQIIKDSLAVYQAASFAQLNLELICELDAQILPHTLSANKLKQILANLFKNAAENLPTGSCIWLRSQANVFMGRDTYTLIEIKDNGAGLSKRVCDNLFKPQPHAGTSNQGLGLSIVQGLAQDLGGFISYQGNQPSGCYFQLYLPNNT